MKKIIVPTDFSDNSKAGLQFALHWSTIEKLDLTFVHVIHMLKPIAWTDEDFFNQVKKESSIYKDRLKKFMEEIFDRSKITPTKYRFIVLQGISADLSILDYCNKRNDVDFLCMSTAGAGGLKKIFGTNTGNLIAKSKVPVIAVPNTYQVGSFEKIIYATDFLHSEEELKKVIAFARGIKARVEMLHFARPGETLPDKRIIEAGIAKIFKFPIMVKLEPTNVRYSFVENLQRYISEKKPSVMIMFTDQKRNVIQKTFLSSRSEQLSFQLKTPLLVFNKNYTS